MKISHRVNVGVYVCSLFAMNTSTKERYLTIESKLCAEVGGPLARKMAAFVFRYLFSLLSFTAGNNALCLGGDSVTESLPS